MLGRKVRKAASAIMLILCVTSVSVFAFNIQPFGADLCERCGNTVVKVIPETVELGPENVTGKEFTIACVIEDVMDLAGVDIQFMWNTTYLDYVSHTRTAPVEDYPTSIPPSPYGGIVHQPLLTLADEPNDSPGIYWVAFATLGGPSFNGSGTVFIMTFRVKNQPSPNEEDVTLGLHFLSVDLARSTAAGGGPIPRDIFDGTVIIRALELVHKLIISSSPVAGIPFTINGDPKMTLYTDWLPEGSYTLEMPETHDEYSWYSWLEDGDTNRIKTITLSASTIWTAVYTTFSPSPPIGGTTVLIKSERLSSWIISTLLMLFVVLASSIYLKRKKCAAF